MSQIILIASSPQMKRIAATVRRSRGRPLLLTGETGVGKDMLARWAHSISPNAAGTFVAINCAAIQDPLWESEIFGHVKGAFTGAVTDKPGQVELADGGTLFLNEIGDMPLPTQAKLLTFLDKGEFQRVGETRTRSVQTRVIAATNHDLERTIEEGTFRRDLFYRLAGVHVKIPPLCERPDDILALANIHLENLLRERGSGSIALADSAKDVLARARWKGNVRELYAVLETALERCLEAGGTYLLPEHFAGELTEAQPPSATPHTREPAISIHGQAVVPDSGPGKGTEDRYIRDPSAAATRTPSQPSSIMESREALRSVLEETKTRTGRWNISEAHRRLVETGRIKIGRRAFARQIRILFPEF